MTIARITVEDGPLTEYPLAEKVRGGWQNGVTFYPDEKVRSVAELVVSRPDDTSITEYLDGLPSHITHVPVSHIRNRLAAHDAQVRAEALREAARSGEFGTTAQSALLARADRIADTNQEDRSE